MRPAVSEDHAPKPDHRQEVDGEHQSPQADIGGEYLHKTMHDTPDDKEPRKGDRSRIARAVHDEQQTGDMKE